MKNKKLLVAVLSISFVLSSQTAKADADSNAKTELTDVAENNQASSTSDSPISENSTNKEGGENDGEATGDDNKTKPEEDNEQEEKDQLVIKTLKVKLGESVDPSLAIENLPKGARVVYDGEKIDTSKAGTRHIDLTIKHDDKSKKDYKLTVELVVEDNKEDTKENSGEDDKNTQKTEKENKSLVNDAQSQNPGLQVADIKMSERVRSSATYEQTVNLELTLKGLNGGDFDADLLPETIDVDVLFTSSGTGEPSFKKTITIKRSDIVGNKVTAKALVEVPEPLGDGKWNAIIHQPPKTVVESDVGSTKTKPDSSISFEKKYFQIINPEIKVKVQDPYKREARRDDDGTITGKLTIDNEFEDSGKADLGFSIDNGNSTDITESEDFVENHDLTELNKPGNPQLKVDNIINGEIKLGKSTYKIQSTYNNKTGGLITLTTTPDFLDPKERDKTYDKPDGYVRVTFKAGEGVEDFEPKVRDIKIGITLPAGAFPTLPAAKIGYKNPTWSPAAGTPVTNGMVITATATKIDDIVPGTEEQPNGYVSVEFKPGENGTLSGKTKYWVNPGAGKKLSDVKKPEVKPADGYKFTGWNKEDTTSITGALEVTAQYKKKVVTENPNDTDYAKVSFVTDKGTVTGRKEYWVLKGETVSLTAPTVNMGEIADYKFKAWNPVVAESYSVDTTHKASFTYTGNDIVPQTGEDKPELPDNFVLVEFKQGAHGTIAETETTKYWVNKDANKTLADVTKPAVTAAEGWKHTGWDKKDTTAITEALEVTAQYKEKVVTENPNDSDYVSVSFKTTKGTVEGTKEYWVLKDETVSLTAPTVNMGEITDYTFKAWDPAVKTTYSENTVHNATFNYTGNDIVPQTGEDKPDVPKNFVLVEFKAGEHGSLTGTTKYWVNPEKGKTLADVTKPSVTANEDFKFTGWDKEDTEAIGAGGLTVTAKYKEKVVTTDPGNTDYAKVDFSAGAHGTIAADATKEYWVLKNEEVTLTAPTVTANEGWAQKTGNDAWDKPLKASYTTDATITAQYQYNGDDVIPQKPGENKPAVPENFVKVEFKAGAHGTIAADQTVIYWVNPEKSVTLTAPTVTANAGWVQKTGDDAWDKPLTGTFKNATDITAQYQENDSHKYEPKGQNIRVKKGDNPKAEDGISNKDKLPESTKYDWKKQPDTSTDGKRDATVVVTYPDGSKDEVKVKVIVTIDGSIIRPIPKLESIPEKVDFGGVYNLTDNIKNLPEGASVIDITPEGVIDVNKTGEYTGKVKVNFKDGSSRVVDVEVIVGKSQADRLTPIIPAEKTGVKNLENLTDKEKEKVKGKIDEANKGNFPDGTKVEVDNKGKAIITYPDKSKDIIQATDLVFQYEHGEPAIEEKPEMTIADIINPSIPDKTEVTDKDKLTDDEKEEVKGKIEEANKDKFPEDTKVVVGKDGGASITYPDGSVDTIQGSDLVIEKTVDNGGNLPGGDDHKTGGDDYKPGDKQTDAEKNPAQKPNKTEVDNPNDLTEEEKDKVKKEVKKVNPKAKDVDVDSKGNATLTYPDGSKNHIPASDTVVEKKKVKPQTKTDAENNPAIIPSDKTGVIDKDNLTDEERRQVAENVNNANPKAVDIIIDTQGNARLIYADGSSNYISSSDLVYEKAKDSLDKQKEVKINKETNTTNRKAYENVKTGVESVTGFMANLLLAVGGLFVSKKKKDEDR